MAFIQQDMQKRIEAFTALKEAFSRLEAQEKAMRKQLDLPGQGGKKTDLASLSPELRRQVEQAVAVAKRAGEARAAQNTTAEAAVSASRPGAGRRGVVRL